MDPLQKRERDERRLTGLKAGAVGLTVAGLGVFAGLAAAGSDSTPTTPSPSAMPGSSQAAQDAARAAEDGGFFDGQAVQGAVGAYQGDDHAQGHPEEYDEHGEYGDGDEHEEHEEYEEYAEHDAQEAHGDSGAYGAGAHGAGAGGGAAQGAYAAPSQGSSGAS